MHDLRTIARLLGGNVIARDQVAFPGPGHSRRDRSCTLRVSPNAPEGWIVFGHAGDDWQQLKDYVRERLGLPEHDAAHGSSAFEFPAAPPASELLVERARMTAQALRLWNDAVHPLGTPVETYVVNRCGEFPPGTAGEALRYHPACPFGDGRLPCMVALVRDCITGEPRAIHRTAITADGRKAPDADGNGRKAYGPIAGGAIMLTPSEHVTYALGIGEGIETALSLRHVAEFGPSPVWACISAGNLERFPILAGVETLFIAVDDDLKSGTGERSAKACAERWSNSDREVFLIQPIERGADLNDLVQRRLANAV